MKGLSLFSGIGGLDLGLERAGITTVGQVEIDPWCRRVLAKHWPDVPRHDDVRTAAAWWLGQERPYVDVIFGGFPCQDISNAGRRAGIDGERSGLWSEFHGIIRLLRPRWVLLENVAAILARGAGRVLGDLAEIGYDAEWDCIPAAAIGANHYRDRWFAVAYPSGPRGRIGAGWREQQPEGSQAARSLAYAGGIGCREGPREFGWLGTAGCGAVMADTHECGRLERTRTCRIFDRQPESADGGWWRSEPDVGRVASRISPGLDGGLNAHAECLAQGRAAGVPATDRLRVLREHITASEAPSRPERCALCGHPLPALPCRGACAPWYMGGRREAGEDLRCVREGLLGLLPRQGEDLLAGLSGRARAAERTQTVGSRVDRLRGLGNAVVPQVAEHVGRLIIAADVA